MMTDDAMRALVLRERQGIAPEVDGAALDPTRPIRDQVDIDSVDVLRLLVALHEATGVDVPESAYAEVATVDGCVAYLVAHQRS
jgi:acyl carrier protein